MPKHLKISVRLKRIKKSLSDIRDNQSEIKCWGDECVCNEFDIISDKLTELTETFEKAEKADR